MSKLLQEEGGARWATRLIAVGTMAAFAVATAAPAWAAQSGPSQSVVASTPATADAPAAEPRNTSLSGSLATKASWPNAEALTLYPMEGEEVSEADQATATGGNIVVVILRYGQLAVASCASKPKCTTLILEGGKFAGGQILTFQQNLTTAKKWACKNFRKFC